MLRKDLIMRQFEEFGKVLSLILGFKRAGDWEAFEKEIEKALSQFTPFQIEHVENLAETDFEKEVTENKNLSFEQKKIIASLLFEKMNYHVVMKDETKLADLRSKCLHLYRHLQENFTENEFDLDVHYKLEFLKNNPNNL